MRRVCVYAGSSNTVAEHFLESARQLGTALGTRGLGMVYGGASVGLMGACADAALTAGSEVTGVLPRQLTQREIAHHGLTELRIVSSLHERKAVMSALSDAFVALPGGCGTLDELFEAITWAQLGLHDKPIGLLDVDGYYGDLLAFIEHAVEQKFVPQRVRDALVVAATPDDLLQRLFAAPPIAPPRAEAETPRP
jgi:uncharacterized protein (TIGR00730 family)